MFYKVIIVIAFILFLLEEFFLLKKFQKEEYRKKNELLKKLKATQNEEKSIKESIDDLEKMMGEYFFFYELARKVSPLMGKKELLNVFSEEIKYLESIEEVRFNECPEGYLAFKLGEGTPEFLCIKTASEKLKNYLPNFAKLLSLCIERISLYEKLQRLSIYDSLTDGYNRRYFMIRYLEEFERAKKLGFKLSFLMVDIDNFKRINDTYGHLVGDVILREITRLIKENIREIDFVARFGGEEFSIILPETDKGGAIMVGERIRSKVSQERIRAFDEVLDTTISVGVASYPQNTLHSDVLMEIADKALCKAKSLGKNRVCWF
jgi:diguanylate cyclase (GGDEF)-like protein